MKDLLSLAARKLVMGGRLVYLLPVHSRLPYNIDRDLPRHPCLKRVAVAGEYLKCGFTRFMVTMEKVQWVGASALLPSCASHRHTPCCLTDQGGGVEWRQWQRQWQQWQQQGGSNSHSRIHEPPHQRCARARTDSSSASPAQHHRHSRDWQQDRGKQQQQ